MGREGSPFFRSLNGTWKFRFLERPTLAPKDVFGDEFARIDFSYRKTGVGDTPNPVMPAYRAYLRVQFPVQVTGKIDSSRLIFRCEQRRRNHEIGR